MHIVSINTARVAPLFVNESGNAQTVMTGIRKQSVSDGVMINRLGLAGDEQADADAGLGAGDQRELREDVRSTGAGNCDPG